MIRQNPFRLRTVLVGLLLLSGSGCNSGLFDWLPPSPFAADERTSFATPAKRIAALHTLAEQAATTDPAEQQRVSIELARQIQHEEDPLMREEIIRTLAEYPTPTAQAVLRAGLKDNDPHVRTAASDLLARQGSPDAVAALAEVLQSDTDLNVRLAAARGLGNFEGPTVVTALAPALDDPNPALQNRAMQSLQAASDRDYGNDVEAWRQFARGETPTPREPTSVAERLQYLWPF